MTAVRRTARERPAVTTAVKAIVASVLRTNNATKVTANVTVWSKSVLFLKRSAPETKSRYVRMRMETAAMGGELLRTALLVNHAPALTVLPSSWIVLELRPAVAMETATSRQGIVRAMMATLALHVTAAWSH